MASGLIQSEGPGSPIQYIRDAALSGNYLYVLNAEDNDNISVVDVSVASAPVVVATLLDGQGGGINIDDPTVITISGNYAYIVSRQSRSLEIINISNPTSPTHVGTLIDDDEETPGPGTDGPYLAFPSAIAVSNGYAYITGYNGMEVVDVSNPASPQHVTVLYDVPSPMAPSPPTEPLVFVQGIAIKGNYAYIVNNAGATGVLSTIDISNPAAPTRVHRLENNNAGVGPMLTNATDVKISGNQLYVTVMNDALSILDISTPTTPVPLSIVKHNNTIIKMDEPSAVAVEGNYAYVVSRISSSLEVIDVSSPASPQHVTAIVSGNPGVAPQFSNSNSIIVSGNYAYIAGQAVQIMSIFQAGPPEFAAGAQINNEYDQSTKIRYKWINVAGLTYTIEVSTDNFVTRIPGYDGAPVTGGTMAQGGSGPNNLQNHVTGLTPNTTYKLRMRAVNINGPSDPSVVLTITTAPAAPVASAPTQVGFDSFFANWQSVPGATGYRFYLYDQGSLGFPNSHFDGYPTGNVTTFDLSGGTAGILPAFNYLYRVSATSPNGESPQSNIISLTTKPYYTIFKPATSVTSTSFVANWNPDPNSLAVITHFALDVATDDAFTQLVTGYNDLNVGLVTTKLVENLSPGTTYYYRLRTVNATGASPNSPDEISVTTVPPAPVLNAATAISTSGFTANWNAAAGAIEYRVDVATNESFTGIVSGYSDKIVAAPTTTLAVTGLAAGQEYFYRVKAYNGGVSGTNGVTQLITLPTAPTPAAPTLVGQAGFTANWTAVTGASHYFIDVSTDALFATILTDYTNLQVTGLTKVVTGLSANTTYHYRVRAANASGSSASSTVVAVLTGPSAPVATAALTPTQTSFIATWNSVTSATGYQVDVSGSTTFSSFVTAFENAASSTTSLNITGLSAGTTYHYRVRAINASGSSNSSNVISQITVPATPAIATTGAVTGVGQTQFTVNWNAATGAVKYFVDVKDVGGNNITGYGNVETTALTLAVTNGISAGTAYQYVVRAENTAGTSPSSTAQSVLTVPATPVAATAGSITTNGFTAKWAAATGATKYLLTVATDPAFTVGSIVGTNNADVGNVLEVPLTNLAAATTYYYRVSAQNGSGVSPVSATITVVTLALPVTSFDTIVLPTGGALTNYKVVSIPDGTTASTLLSEGSFKTNWRMMHFDGTRNNDVQAVSTMVAGLGYWVNSNIDPAPTITLTGTFVANNKTLTLHPGWNQIGNPFNFSISWADVLAKNSPATGVGPKFFTYNGPAGEGFKPTDGLLAYGGGFVNNHTTSNVTLTIPASVVRFTGRVAAGKYDIQSDDISADEWFVPLTLQSGTIINDLAGIGMHPDAKGSYDPFDDIALPRFFEYAELSSNHPEYFQPRFMRDVTPPGATRTWTFVATSNGGDDADLTWDNSNWQDGIAQLYLFDEEEGVLLDMRTTNRYSFKANGPRSLRIFYGRDGNISPEITGFGTPYPNPASVEVTFPFLAERNDEVQVRLFDMTGKPVQTLVAGAGSSGYRELTWNGTDVQGGRVPAGMYLYRFAGKSGKTRIGKIVLR